MIKFVNENFVMPFGKYKGKDLLEISESNPSYIIWLDNADVFRVSNELLKYCNKKINDPTFHGDWGWRDK